MAHRPAGWSSDLAACPSMLRRPCGRAMRSKGRVGVDAVASKPGVAKEVLPLTRRILRLRLLKGGSWVSTTPCRTHGLKSGACRRPETERQGPPWALTRLWCGVQRVRYTRRDRPSSSIRLSGPPGAVTCASSLRCEPHSRLQPPRVTAEGLSTNPPPRQQYTASRLGTWRGPAGSRATVANAKGNLAPLLSRVARRQCPWSSGVMNVSSKYVAPHPPH